MSNSAFTPSTTTVTNNVPTNVPVVTAWEAYTPTFEGFGTPTSVSALWRRNGDTIEVTGNFTAGIPTTSIATISLPSGLNLDSTKINGNGQFQILGNLFRSTTTPTAIPALTRGPFAVIDSKLVSTAKVFLSIQTNSSSGGAFDAATGQNILATGEMITFQFRAPISQWAGSGTTTLATRAVEEYAYNTNTGASNDTSSFGYGPDGVLFPNITTYGTIFAKRVRFQTSILSTDSIIVEYQQAGTGVWRSTAQRMPYVTMGNSAYGIQILNVSSTDVEIQFNSQGAVSNGLTYASNGEPWSAYHGAGWKWRVRKISSGAQVGYPVSARNIVGDTSGSVVPVGMLGEVVQGTLRSGTGGRTFSVRSSTALTTGYNSLVSITLSKGVYIVNTTSSWASSSAIVGYGYIAVGGTQITQEFRSNAPAGYDCGISIGTPVIIESDSTTVALFGRSSSIAGLVTNGHEIMAIRIA